jgi:hypothetical protein
MEARQFIRHPVTLPIEVAGPVRAADNRPAQAHSIGVGGLAFRCNQSAEPGTLLRIRIPYLTPEFETDARVVWCRTTRQGIELGVEFLNSDDAFRVRMVEQVCHIESYRQQVRNGEGRLPSPEDAAAEWIRKYAATFPGGGLKAEN